jgi:hypothetical protein
MVEHSKGNIMGEIYVSLNELERLATICAELTRQSIAFTTRRHGDEWKIELTGY